MDHIDSTATVLPGLFHEAPPSACISKYYNSRTINLSEWASFVATNSHPHVLEVVLRIASWWLHVSSFRHPRVDATTSSSSASATAFVRAIIIWNQDL